MNHLIEYWQVCEYLWKEWELYKVKIVKPNETIEKLVKYEPIPNHYQYDWVMVQKDWKYFILNKYTTYWKDKKLVYAYKAKWIAKHTDDLVYEYDVWVSYKIVEKSPFLSDDEVQKLLTERDEKLNFHNNKIHEYKNLIKEEEAAKSKIEKEFDIDSKCKHEWELWHEEEEWKRTTREYYCTKCNKTDIQNWYSLF